MNQLMRRVAMSLALPLVVGAPAVLVAAPAEATGATVTISALGSIVYGQPLRATADVTDMAVPITEGSVQFSVRAPGESEFDDVGGRVPVDSSGHLVGPVLVQADGHPLDVTEGSNQWSVRATYWDVENMETTAHDTTFVSVNQANSSTAVLPTASTLVADISGVVPGGSQPNSLQPTGPVQFKVNGAVVGSANAVNGEATLSYVLGHGPQTVTATYAGDDRYGSSSAARTRNDPVILARVLSAFPRSKSGWYSSAVTVWFICQPRGSELVQDCPDDVTLKKSGKGQSVVRTIAALDGGSATVTVTGIDIDRDPPVIKVKGRSCTATDKLSGVKGACHMNIAPNGTYRAVAVDKAGNRAVKRGTVS